MTKDDTMTGDTESMRTFDEIQRAHDLLVNLICRPDILHALDPAAGACVLACADVLCWTLRHTHNDAFEKNLRQLETCLVNLGIELVPYPDGETKTRRTKL